MASKNQMKLGRLSAFGIEQPWQTALLMPRKWDDLSDFDDRFPSDPAKWNGHRCVLVLRVMSEPKRSRAGQSRPLTTFQVRDVDGNVGQAAAWGNAEEIVSKLKLGRRAAFLGNFKTWNGEAQFTITETVDPRWLNRYRPVYPGKPKVIGADLVRKRVIGFLPMAIPEAAQEIIKRLAMIGDETALMEKAQAGSVFPNIEAVLWQAHLPDSPDTGEEARTVLARLAALDMLVQAMADHRGQKAIIPLELSMASRSKRTNALPFGLTSEQSEALDEITADLRRPAPMHRLLTGDVGTGKTAVYGSAVAIAADAGATAGVLLPNVALAAQVHREMTEWWPDMDIRLVEAGKANPLDRSAQVVIGTTALLSGDVGNRDFLVVDEQQKFSREQREQLAGNHLLEVSATCIPRSQALAAFGVSDVSMLKSGHVDKTVHTRIRTSDERKQVFLDCRQTVEDGHQLAIVYPVRDAGDGKMDDETARKSATHAFAAWEKHYPGRVRLVHGQMTDADKKAALEDMREDHADVLVSTTVIEVGLTLPRLRRLMVVDAERYGLTTLHQLRGRLARHGGVGHFDLFLTRDVPEESRERLECLEKTNDGFELAEMDLALRGTGDLAGTQQHGAVDSLLIGYPVDVQHMAEVAESILGARTRPEPIKWKDDLSEMSADDFVPPKHEDTLLPDLDDDAEEAMALARTLDVREAVRTGKVSSPDQDEQPKPAAPRQKSADHVPATPMRGSATTRKPGMASHGNAAANVMSLFN